MQIIKTKSFFILMLIFCSISSSFSQNMVVKGIVYDTSGVNVLPNAIVMAVRFKDSLLLSFDHTDKEGSFSLPECPVDSFTLIISYPKCDDKTFYIFGSLTNLEIIIPKIKMQSKSLQLEEVIVYANKNPIFYRGDTLVYVADSFKVGPNAVVEDLLRKLPGIKVDKDGKLKSQGKEITQVLVDGDEFFGGDASIATKNLAADGIKTVEVYEKKAEDGGDETTQVLNLKLKEEAKKGYFGRVSGASDFQNFYQGEFLANKFNGTQKISVFAMGANTPNLGVSWQDQNKFGLENENPWNRDEDGNYSVSSSTPTGIPQVFKSGIYFSDKIGKNKKTKFNFNYTFHDSRVHSNSLERSQFLLTDTTYFSDDSTRNYSLNQSHLFTTSILTQLDSLTSIYIAPKITFSNGSSDRMNTTNFLSELESLSKSTRINSNNESKGITFSNELTLVRKFKKPKRELVVKYSLNSKQNNTNGFLFSSNRYYDGISLNDSIDQLKLNQNNTLTNSGKISYSEPLTKRWLLNFEYLYENINTFQNKETRNNQNGEYSEIDVNYSNSFESIRQQNRVGTSIQYKMKKYSIEGLVRIRNIDVVNNTNQTGQVLHQNFTNILPNVFYSYIPSQNKRLHVQYKTSVKQPSLIDVMPIPDNSNPNRLVIGNTSLVPSYSHNISLNFNSWQSLSGRYIYINLNGNVINNDFTNSTSYNPSLISKTESKTVNVNGNYNGNFNGGFSFPLFDELISIAPDINTSYSKRSSFINDVLNTTQTKTIGGNLGLSVEADSIRFTFYGDFSYSLPTNSISSVSNSPYTTNILSAEFELTLPWKLKIKSDATYTMNGQRSNGYSINYLIWNAEINRSFLKTENLILSLIGNDILNQNISAQRNINLNVITDSKTQIISRYFLLKLTMKFNNNKTKENDNTGW